MGRYRQLLKVLAVHGFGEMVHQSGTGRILRFLGRLLPSRKERKEKLIQQYSTWERIRMMLEELGPTFVKFGQILSNRPDLVPRELLEELGKLQDRAAPFSAEKAAALLEEELGAPVDQLFRQFDREPAAAASMAQIHRAVLPGGRETAVKIQRPGLKEQVSIDIEILKDLAALVEKRYPEALPFQPRVLAREYERSLQQELDFRRESSAMQRFSRYFGRDSRIKIPQVYPSLSTGRILTMEFIRGRSLAEFLKEGPPGEQGRELARTGAQITLKQIFTFGFFHADPHPGNLFILEDGRLCYLDFGLTGTLIQRDLETVSSILLSIINRNEQRAARGAAALAGCRDYRIAENIERDIAELISRFQNARAGDFSFPALLTDLIDILVGQGLNLPIDLFLLMKALITIEGIATQLDPDFDFARQLEPFAQELVRNRFEPDRLKQTLGPAAGDYTAVLQSLPGDYYRVVDSLASGRIRLSVEEESLKPIRHTILQASSALSYALVLSSLIIGSALIVLSRVPPLWHGIPVIGIAGFCTAGLMGFGLLIRIIRTGGM